MCFTDNAKDQSQSSQIQTQPNVLCQTDIQAIVCYLVEEREEIDKASWIYQRACIASHNTVVSFSCNERSNFLVVCNPVDLGVRDKVDYKEVQDCLSGKNKTT